MKSLFASAFLMLLMLQSCGGSNISGTETGNPPIGEPSNNSPSTPAVIVPANAPGILLDIASTVCSNLFNRCNYDEIRLNLCAQQIAFVTTFDTEIGVTDGYVRSMQDYWQDESNGQIVENFSARDRCIEELFTMACDDPRLLAAYDPGDPDNWEHLPAMLPQDDGSCRQVVTSIQPPQAM